MRQGGMYMIDVRTIRKSQSWPLPKSVGKKGGRDSATHRNYLRAFLGVRFLARAMKLSLRLLR